MDEQPVRDMDAQQLNSLCASIRSFLLSSISKTGGHLASSLGTVEIIAAIHKVFDTSIDRLIFDVGHQAYAHKILTGRGAGFATLRQWGSLSGFPHPAESVHDAFVAGHASTSVSLALGMARARTLTGGDYHCIALLGDGALTGGLCYEAMNDAGQSAEPMIIILNDNGMSITKNVGGVARHLAKLRSKPQYFRLKHAYHKLTDPLPGGKSVNRYLHNLKRSVRYSFLPGGSLFESMGFIYYGPADGHDIMSVVNLLTLAKSEKKPVLIHLKTKKGKGYRHSEKNPAAFHGVTSFDVCNGETPSGGAETYSARFGKVLTRIADTDARVVAITAAMRSGVGLDAFYKKHPKRMFDVAIAEGHAVTMAAAMAKQGLKPVVAIYSSFLQRAYDMLIHDVALSALPVVFAVDRAGLVGEDGVTHQGIFDVGFLSQIPHMTVLAPASLAELEVMLTRALSSAQGPVAIRYPRGGEGGFLDCTADQDFAVLSADDEYAILTYGAMTGVALEAADTLSKAGLPTGVVKLNRLSPLPARELLAVLPKQVAVLEDVVENGSVCQRLAAEIGLYGASHSLIALNLGQRFIPHGSVEDQRRHTGLCADGVCRTLLRGWS